MRKYQVLTDEQVQSFLDKGYLVVNNCLVRDIARSWIDQAYERLGYDKNDPSTWAKDIVWMDHKNQMPVRKLAPKAWAVVAAGTCATYGGIHAMEGNPTGCMGLADYLGWDWRSKAGLPIVNVPGCPVQPDNFMEVVLYLLYMAVGMAPVIPLRTRLGATSPFAAMSNTNIELGTTGT